MNEKFWIIAFRSKKKKLHIVAEFDTFEAAKIYWVEFVGYRPNLIILEFVYGSNIV